MKLRLAIYTLYVVILFAVCFLPGIIKQLSTVNTPVVEQIVFKEKTLDSEIDRLATNYGLSSSTVRAVIDCEGKMYGGAIHNNIDKETGLVWSKDYGLLQINDYFHEEKMLKLGLDIHNQFDSLEYGFILMKSEGLKPWSASKSCWGKKIQTI